MGDACSGLSFQIENAIQDLVVKLKVSKSDVSLVEAKETTWPNICLGNPKHEGLDVCGDTPTPGYLIILESANKKYQYHADNANNMEFIGLTKD